MPQIYRQSDIFVSATLQEGMSNAMLEAMACGLPIVTTPCEGIEELIGDNGIVVGQTSAQAIAGAVKSIVDNDQLYNKMCTQARARAEQFNWKNVADQYLQMYFNVKRRYTLGDTI
jgi:glycosyltransferase involved in cell wall biosynthesis